MSFILVNTIVIGVASFYSLARLLHSILLISSRNKYLFGIDTLYQDSWDLGHHNSSNRALARHKKYGSTYTSYILGRSTIHTIEPANIHSVTTGNFADYEKGSWAQMIAKYMGNGILVNDGAEWHASRNLLKPLLKRNKAADISMFELHVKRLIDDITTQKGEFVDFRKACQMTVLGITTEMLTGKSSETARLGLHPVCEGKRHLSEELDLLALIDELEPYGDKAIELGPFSLPIFVLHYRKITSLVRGIQKFFSDAITSTNTSNQDSELAKNDRSKNFDLITYMISEGLSPSHVQGELQNIFFAAFDTTTALMTNLFDHLSQHPLVVLRLKSELAQVTGNTDPVNEVNVSRLILLRATIWETLRLHSPVTYHTRTARIDTTLPHGNNGQCGHVPVPKGTAVSWSTYSLNRLPQLYGSDSEEFRPERWLGEDGALKDKDGFMPFGTGPRNCLGQQFAMMEVTYIAARLLGAFESFEIREDCVPWREAAAVTNYNGRGTWIRFALGR